MRARLSSPDQRERGEAEQDSLGREGTAEQYTVEQYTDEQYRLAREGAAEQYSLEREGTVEQYILERDRSQPVLRERESWLPVVQSGARQ